MLLGRANSKMSVTTGRLQAGFTVEHPVNQVDLMHWKATEIERVFAVKVRYAQQQRCFSFTAGRRVRIIHQWFHCTERKVITPKIRFMNHPIGLAMLLCDRGSVRKPEEQTEEGSFHSVKPSITLAVCPFAESEVLMLLTHIKALFGATGYIEATHRAKATSTVWFTPENSQIIWDVVEQWIPQVSSMQSKFQDIIQCYGK